jgi:hypothetical protein
MKHILMLAAAILFVSCDKGTKIIIRNDVPFDKVEHFSYRGHKYIKFSKYEDWQNGICGIVHDPNCNNHK